MGDAVKPRLWPALVATAVALAMAGDQLWLGWNARSAEVSHLLEAPPLALWIPVSLLVVAALAAAIWGLRTGHPRLPRLPLLAAVLVAFIDAFVMPPARPLAPRVDALLAIQSFAQAVQELQREGRPLPQTVEELQPALEEQLAPPYLARGKHLDRWSLVVRRGCSGPDTGAAGLAAGTFIYCLSTDGRQAWITAVGRGSTTFGPPELLQDAGTPFYETLAAPQQGTAAQP